MPAEVLESLRFSGGIGIQVLGPRVDLGIAVVYPRTPPLSPPGRTPIAKTTDGLGDRPGFGPRNVGRSRIAAARRFLGAGLLALATAVEAGAAAPYPDSEILAGIHWDASSIRALAPGSDNWPITWSDDDHQYTSWGDGGGFGGSNSLGRVSLGFGRIVGSWDNYVGQNVWGGHNTEYPATFAGKSYGIISVDGVLYVWRGFGGDNSAGFVQNTELIWSLDKGASWFHSGTMWTNNDNLYGPSFLNFGKDNAGARDGFVYSYFPRGSTIVLHKPGAVDLARVPKQQITNKSAYEWFAGLDGSGNPTWTSDSAQREPVFEDANGVRTATVTYNPGLGRYLLTNQHSVVGRGPTSNQIAVFEAPEPWGPWRTVVYETNWVGGTGNISLYFAPKWWRNGGSEFTLVYTRDDHWATIDGTFQLGSDTVAPTLTSASSVGSGTEVQVVFSEPLDTSSAETVANYLISPSVPVMSATLQADLRTVTLATGAHQDGQQYTLRVDNVRDDAPSLNPIAPGSSLDYTHVSSGANRPPVAVDDSIVATAETVTFFNVLANDSDPDGDPVIVAQWIQPQNGVVEVDAQGQSNYVASSGFTGTDSFTYVAEDAWGAQATATVLITVSATPGGGEALAHWSFDDQDPTRVTDSGTSGLHGALVGAPTYTSGRFGAGLLLDGVDDFVDIPGGSPIADLDRFSYSAWIYPTDDGDREILSKASSNRELRLAGAGNALTLRGCVVAATSAACSNAVNGTVFLQQWHHVAMTYDDGSDRMVRLFVDGQEVSYSQQTTAQGAISSDLTSPLNIGRRTTANRYFAGVVDEVRVFGRVLSGAEISSLWQDNTTPGGSPPLPPPVLLD